MELHEFDLNLLVVFNHLMVERRVSKVADTLGLTQPAVSNSLAKLRKRFGDELFLRTPRGMEPTPYAEQLATAVTQAMALLHDGINQQSHFRPASSDRSFRIGMTDIGEIYFLPSLIERLARDAPGVRISTVRDTTVDIQDEMAAGHVDLAVGLLPQLKAGFFQRRLFRQSYVCLMRKGHVLDKGRPLLADVQRADHLVVVPAGTGHTEIEPLLRRAGIEPRVKVSIPHFLSVGHILQGTDLIATVPISLAERLTGPFGLVHHQHPARLPYVAINAFWHAKFHRSPANQWLRGVVFDLFCDRSAVGER